jgi:DNA-binding winged helix-turn-helix (wHTH) protein/Tol biopolymer transport system component
MPADLRDLFEFGPFTLDAEDGSLTRGGEVIPLSRLAADVLIVLLENPGRVFSREEISGRVWNTSVGGGSLDYQIHQIRQALEPDGNELVQNVRRRGFRFTGTVRRVQRQNHQIADRVAAVLPRSDVGEVAAAGSQRRPRWIIPIAVAVTLVMAGLAAAAIVRSTAPESLRVIESKALTQDGPPGLGYPVLTDGRRLYYGRIVDGRHLSMPISGGDSTLVFDAASEFYLSDPGSGSDYLAIKPDQTGKGGEIWVIPTGSGVPHRVGALTGGHAVWSPDRRHIAFTTESGELKLADADGGNLADVQIPREGGAMHPRWSPDGTRVRFTLNEPRDGLPHASLWEVASHGGEARLALPEWDQKISSCCGVWTPDGRHFVFEVLNDDLRTDLWTRSEPSTLDAWLGRAPSLTRLTSGPLSMSAPVVGADGRTIFTVGALRQGELVRWDSGAKAFVPYLQGISGTFVSFSADAQWIAYAGYPDRKLWRVRADGSERRELVSGGFDLDGVMWSPDGRWISFRSRMKGRHMKVFVMPSSGGRPEPVTAEDHDEGIASWAPDSHRIVFGDVPSQFGVPSGGEVLHLYDLEKKTLSSVPQSEGLWTSRWSPDGRYIAALTINMEQRLKLFDTTSGLWSTTSAVHVNNPNWSRDTKSLFYDTEGGPHALRRFRIEDNKVVEITAIAFLRPVNGWSGLAPDDSPIVLKNLTSPAVYALTVESRP